MPALAQAAAPAPQNQIDVGAGYYGTDPTGVYANFQSATTNGQSAKYSPSANWNGKYTYSLPLDSSNTLKFALADDGWYGFYTGNVNNNAVESGQNVGIITPLAEYLGYGADITLSVPMYYYNPADAGGYSELKYAYKEGGYLPVGSPKRPRAPIPSTAPTASSQRSTSRPSTSTASTKRRGYRPVSACCTR